MAFSILFVVPAQVLEVLSVLLIYTVVHLTRDQQVLVFIKFVLYYQKSFVGNVFAFEHHFDHLGGNTLVFLAEEGVGATFGVGSARSSDSLELFI